MKHLIARFVKDESGATAIEYGLIAAGIALAIIAAVNGLGTNLNNTFTSINTSLRQVRIRVPNSPIRLIMARWKRSELRDATGS